MPPKEAAQTKKAPALVRPSISSSSLVFVPEDAVEGYQERIETGINWTLLEQAARHHKNQCLSEKIASNPFSQALQTKLQNSLWGYFMNEHSGLTLEQLWEFLLPVSLWDNEYFGNDEEKICFMSANNITDDMISIIKKAVQCDDREVLRREFKLVNILRVNDAEMTELDEDLMTFKLLVSLNLCGNYIGEVNPKFIPENIRSLELQANRIKDVEFCEYLPPNLIYLGLARNFLMSEDLEPLSKLPRCIEVLDLSDNDIYELEPVLNAIGKLPYLTSLYLAGNPCSVCAAYAFLTISRLPRLQWLDGRQILITDRVMDFEPHPDDLRSAYFNFTIFRIMSAPMPPKPEKGAVATFHVELEIPLLDSHRRNFLMFRHNESLTEMLPIPEDEEWLHIKSEATDSKSFMGEMSAHDSDIYKRLSPVNSRIIRNFTTFESNKIQWNKVMNFQEPAVKIFCPDLRALRDTFRTVITVKLVYTLTITTKPTKEKKSALSLKPPPAEQRVVLASMRCALQKPDWSQPSQHFHWDDSLESNDAIHWGDGDLSILQYTQVAPKAVKGKPDADVGSSKQTPPENLTCHFGFGIDTLRS